MAAAEISCLRTEDVFSRLSSRIPLPTAIKYYVHQAFDGTTFHVALNRDGTKAHVGVIKENNKFLAGKTLKKIKSILGLRGNENNNIVRAIMVRKRHKDVISVTRRGIAALYRASHLASGPYLAVCSEAQMRIIEIELDKYYLRGLLIRNVKDNLDILIKNSVVHRGFLIVFLYEEERTCRRVDERVIYVTSPIFESLVSNFPIMLLTYTHEHFNHVYLFIPECRTLLIVDPTTLRVSENQLLIDDSWKYEECHNSAINLIGVSNGTVSIGLPEINPQSRQLTSYHIWTGEIPNPITWSSYQSVELQLTEEDESTKNLEDQSIKEAIRVRMEQSLTKAIASKIKTEKSASWNVDVPEFVPLKDRSAAVGDCNKENEKPLAASKVADNKEITDEETQTDGSEAESLKEGIMALERLQDEQRERLMRLQISHEKLVKDNKRIADEHADRMYRLRVELQRLKSSNEMLVKNKREVSLTTTSLLPDRKKKENIDWQDLHDLCTTIENDDSEDDEEAPEWDEVDLEHVNVDDDLSAIVEATAREFDDNCGIEETHEADDEPVLDPWIGHQPNGNAIGSEKKRRNKEEEILKNISDFVPDWSSSLEVDSFLASQNDSSTSFPQDLSLDQPSPTLPPLPRCTTPFGALFSGDNFSAWSESGTDENGWSSFSSTKNRDD